MGINSSRIIQLSRKYGLLLLVVMFSICAGYIVYYSDVGIDMSIDTSAYASEIDDENSVSQISLEDIVSKNKVITEKLETEDEEIEYTTVSFGDSRTGNAVVLSEGSNGIATTTYKVKYENDVEIAKAEVGKAIKKKATAQIVTYGSSYSLASRGDYEREAPVDGYTNVIKMRYTAYCLCEKCCGKSPSNPGYGVTASGYRIIPGNNDKVVAVDPSVIKLGSKVYVENLSGKADYGYALAADTGGAIKGNRIDLYVDSHSEALRIGTGYCQVYILQ